MYQVYSNHSKIIQERLQEFTQKMTKLSLLEMELKQVCQTVETVYKDLCVQSEVRVQRYPVRKETWNDSAESTYEQEPDLFLFPCIAGNDIRGTWICMCQTSALPLIATLTLGNRTVAKLYTASPSPQGYSPSKSPWCSVTFWGSQVTQSGLRNHSYPCYCVIN